MEQLKKLVRPYRIKYYQGKVKKNFQKQLKRADNLKIVVGSGGIQYEGWLLTERHFLDLLKEDDWFSYFEEGSITNILAEHVWEHLTLEQGKKAIAVCHKFLKTGGNLRIAVPDGFHTDPKYIDYVKVNGSGLGAHDHKVLYNYKLLGEILTDAGFTINCLEYFDEKGKFHAIDWSNENGHVYRSIRYDERNTDGKPNYTSLIIDAKKK